MLLLCCESLSAQSAGALDADFDADGIAVYAPSRFRESSFGQALAIQPDGKILLAGSASIVAGNAGNLTLLRVHPDGSPDPSFGDTEPGWSVEDTYVASFSADAVAVLPDGNILAAGTNYDNTAFVFFHFGTAGWLQPDFGQRGISQVPFGNVCRLRAIALQPDGKLVAAGEVREDQITHFALTRIDPVSGAIDPAFSFDGKVTGDFNGAGAVAYAVAIQSDGKILAGGISANQFAMMRFLPDGSLDYSFGNQGKVLTYLGQEASLQAIAIQPDGKILAAGTAASVSWGLYPAFTLLRYLPDGSLDPSFGESGAVSVPNGILRSMALQADGKIVAAGTTYPQSGIQVLRFLPDGAPDPTFGTAGQSIVVANAATTGMQLQPDGNIVVSGLRYSSTPGEAPVKACLVRFHAGVLATEVKEIPGISDISLYPNPVKDVLNCAFELNGPARISIDLWDASGRRVGQIVSQVFDRGRQWVYFPVQYLSPGVYQVKFKSNNNQKTLSFIKP
mgnify:CR=1 FL=1